jgi:hypothetical protein
MEHTPEPWELHESYNLGTDERTISIDGPGSREVCLVFFWDDDGHDRHRADARLIANAPRLKAENKQLQDKVAYWQLGYSDAKHEGWEERERWLVSMRENTRLRELLRNIRDTVESCYVAGGWCALDTEEMESIAALANAALEGE